MEKALVPKDRSDKLLLIYVMNQSLKMRNIYFLGTCMELDKIVLIELDLKEKVKTE